MSPSPTPDRVARALQTSIGLLIRRLRQVRVVADLSQPESTALASLVRNAPATSADLARLENISAQSMHATITTLEQRGFVRRRADATDGRRMLVELTDAGREQANRKRDARAEQFAHALATHFTAEERAQLLATAPLLERLSRTLE